jgi:hypothetical protein
MKSVAKTGTGHVHDVVRPLVFILTALRIYQVDVVQIGRLQCREIVQIRD